MFGEAIKSIPLHSRAIFTPSANTATLFIKDLKQKIIYYFIIHTIFKKDFKIDCWTLYKIIICLDAYYTYT